MIKKLFSFLFSFSFRHFLLSWALILGTTMDAEAQFRSDISVGIGQAYIYKVNNNPISVPIEFPIDHKGILVNWNAPVFSPLPQKFMISNGTVFRSFIYVDKSPGSRLKSLIDYMNKEIRQKLGYQNSPVPEEKILNYLANNIQDYLLWLTKDEEVSVYTWDHDLSRKESLNDRLQKDRERLKDQVSGTWFETQNSHFSVAFEEILKKKKGYCIDMALLASMILESFDISHRLIFGSILEVGADNIGLGHTWIQLPDGRLLDVAWKTLDLPLGKHKFFNDWILFGNQFGSQYRYEYGFFPIIKYN